MNYVVMNMKFKFSMLVKFEKNCTVFMLLFSFKMSCFQDFF